jgi:hypothetical protein
VRSSWPPRRCGCSPVLGGDPGYCALALPLLVGGLGLGLTAPSLIDVALAEVPARDAGTAAGVLTTVSQIGSAAGVAVLGVVCFDRFAATGSAVDAFTATLPLQIGGYAAALLMVLLPARALAPAQRE